MSRPPRRSTSRSSFARSLVTLALLVVGLVLGPAGPAGAHATLIGTDPQQGEVLAAAPEAIRFSYTESVAAVPDGTQVFDSTGQVVASTATSSGSDLVVTLAEPVADGTLVVVWRVISEDGHPVSGSLSFSVGAPSAGAALVPPDVGGATDAPAALSVARAAGYVGLLLAAGLVAFLVLFLGPHQLSAPVLRRVVRLARASAGLAALSWGVALPLTATYQLGTDLGALGSLDTWRVLPVEVYAVAVVVAGGLGAAVGLLGDHAVVGRRAAAALGAALLATIAPALTGHTRAVSPEWLVVGTDALHLVTGALWLGGLVGLALGLRDLAERGAVAGDVLVRFSTWAAGTLALLVVAGSVLTWRILGSWGAILETGYGRLLLVKVGVVGVAVLLAAWNRYRLLPLLTDASKRKGRRTAASMIVGSVRAEAVVLLVVLALTGVLVDRSPEPDEALSAGPRPGQEPRSAMLDDVKVLATLAPLAVGPNTVTIELTDSAGAPAEFMVPPSVRLFNDEVDLGTVPLNPGVVGSHTAEVVLPSSGEWRVQVSLRTSAFDNPIATLAFEVPSAAGAPEGSGASAQN